MANRFTFLDLFNSLIAAVEDASSPKGKLLSAKEAAFICDLLIRSRDVICREYTTIIRRVKERYMENSNSLLDRHKCAAAFMIAFLKKMDMEDSKQSIAKLQKEKLAILAGLTVLGTFIAGEAKACKKKQPFLRFLKRYNGFVFPKTICDINLYIDNWAIELYYARIEKKLFVPSLAHELFYLERYNRLLAETSASTTKQ